MIYQAKQLLSKLQHLVLSGIDNGTLEFIGTEERWAYAEMLGDDQEREKTMYESLREQNDIKVERETGQNY